MEASKTIKKGLGALLAAAAALMVTGCASMGESPEDRVVSRATDRLELVLAEDYTSAYEYLSPGYRSTVNMASYQRQMALRKVRWTSAKVGESDCSDDVCKLTILLEFEVYGAVPGVQRFQTKGGTEEQWILNDGEWYLLPKE